MGRRELEGLAAILAVGGAVFAMQQATSVRGDWLMAGVYAALLGIVLILVAARRGAPSRITLPTRLAVIAGGLAAISLGLLAVAICGPTVAFFSCAA